MTFKWTHRRIILLSIPPLLFVLYVLIGFFGIPAYVRYALITTIAQQTRGQADIGDVSFNPFTLTLRMTNLRIAGGEGDKVVSINRLRANLQVSTLWRSGFALDEFYIKKPSVNLVITENGTFNLARLIKPVEDQEQPGPLLAIATLRLVDGKIDYTDRSLPETFKHQLRDIDLTLNNFNLAPAARNPLYFTAQTPAGEYITWDGSLKLNPLSSEGTIKIETAKTPIYEPYYERLGLFDVDRGRLSMHAEYRFLPMRREPVIEADIDSIVVENLKVGRVESEHEFYRLKRGEVSQMHVDLIGRKLTIHRIWANHGALTVRRTADGNLPIRQAFAAILGGDPYREAASQASVDEDSQAGDISKQVNPKDNADQTGLMGTLQQFLEGTPRQSWMIHLDEFAIEAHALAWIDNSFTEPVELHASKINLTGGPVASEQQYAFPMRLSAQIDDGSSVDLDGKVRPMAPAIDAAVALQNFDLTQINPYLERHTQLAAPQGRVTFDGQAEWALPPDQSVRLTYRGSARLMDLRIAQQAGQDDKNRPSVQVAEATVDDLTISDQPWKIVLPTMRTRMIVLRQDGNDQPSVNISQARLTELTVTANPWRMDLVNGELTDVIVHRGTAEQPVARSAQVMLSSLSGSFYPLTGSLERLIVAAVSLAESIDTDPTFKAETIAVSDVAAQGEPWQLQVQEMALEKPYLLAGVTSEGRFNVQQLLAAWRGEGDESTGDQAEAQPAQMKLDRVRVSNGSGKLFDRRMDEPVTVDLDQLEARIDDVTLKVGEQAQLKVAVRLNQDATLQTNGRIEISDPPMFTELSITGSALTMNQYQPYVERYLGYTVESGQLQLDVTCQLRSRQLDARVHLVLSDFYLGQEVQSNYAIDAPVKLALDLLRNQQGQVELTIPIQGSLADPEFQLASLIIRVMGNMLANIATAPFDVLASLVAPEDKEKRPDLSSVSFSPGSTELSPQAVEQLDTLEQALYKRPAVSLRITGGLAPEADRLPLKRRKFVMRDVPGEIVTDVETAADAPAIDRDAPAYHQVIRQHYQQMQEVESKEEPADQLNANRAEPSFEQMEQAVLKGVEVEQQAFRDLARSRLRAVRQQLLKSGRLATDRIVLGEPSTTPTDQPRVTFEVTQR